MYKVRYNTLPSVREEGARRWLLVVEGTSAAVAAEDVRTVIGDNMAILVVQGVIANELNKAPEQTFASQLERRAGVARIAAPATPRVLRERWPLAQRRLKPLPRR